MSRDQVSYREYYDISRSTSYNNIPEGYRDFRNSDFRGNDHYMKERRDFYDNCSQNYGEMNNRYYHNEFHRREQVEMNELYLNPVPNQRYYDNNNDLIDGQRISKFSNGSNKWDRSNNRKNLNNDSIHNSNSFSNNKEYLDSTENNDNKRIKLDSSQNQSNLNHDKLNLQEVESGIRISKNKLKDQNISIFHTNGKDSIWVKIEDLNKRKLCYNCQKEKWRDKITPICIECYKNLSNSSSNTYSRKECIYCKIEFLQHRILKKATKVFNKIICMDCCKNLCKYNTVPIHCHFCDCWSAWSSHSLCDRCMNFRELYGEPLPCDMCRKNCAFDRGEETKKKLDGRLFCFLCTIKYKKLKYEEVKKTNLAYKKAEKALTKLESNVKINKQESNIDQNNETINNSNVDWKLIAEERLSLYEKAKQHLTELQTKQLTDKIEVSSLISQLKEANSDLERQNKQLDERILHLNAEINDWELKMKNICDEKNKQIKQLKDEKKSIVEEMEDLIQKLKNENNELKETIRSSQK